MWAMNAGCEEGGAVADVPSSEIVVLITNSEDGEEEGDNGVRCPGGAKDSRMEGRGGGNVFCNTSRQRNDSGSSSGTTTTAITTTSTTTAKATDGGGTKEDHEYDNARRGGEDDATSAAPLAGKRRRRNNREDSSSRCSPSHGPPSYGNDDHAGDDNDHDHYYVRFLRVFQRHDVHRCHQHCADHLNAHNEVTQSSQFLDKATPPTPTPM